MNTETTPKGIDKLVRYALRGGLPRLIFFLGLAAGTIALLYTPREEEPQLVVPMVDVLVQAPGLSARQVDRQVPIPVENLLSQIPGVEHVYSATDSGRAAVRGQMAPALFYVGPAPDRRAAFLRHAKCRQSKAGDDISSEPWRLEGAWSDHR